jgi:cyclopropane-fatty-acyl-phospholipid synthase
MTVAEIFQRVAGTEAAFRVTAYDGSEAGSPQAGVGFRIRSPQALAYLASAPGSLGLARAYVTGELEIEGQLHTALAAIAEVTLHSLPRPERIRLAGELLGARLRHRVPVPTTECRPRGRLHSKRRDREAILHHYDVSNRFYSWVLGPSMAYTCAVYETPETTLEQAQQAKHQLVAAKLGLRPGMRLLDVGCGWGGMVRHAASMGVRALGVTLSEQQANWGRKLIVEQGLTELAEIRHLDYRDVPEAGFDAVSSIGLTEHIGARQLPAYFRIPARQAAPGRAVAQPLHHPAHPRGPETVGRVHRPVRVPGRAAAGHRPSDRGHERPRFRDPP